MEIQKNYNFGGWKNCVRMANDEIELIVTTDVGPRIVRFGYTGEQNFFREFKEDQGKVGGKEWRIYGGHRFWHAPEASPRCYYPDNEKVDYELKDNVLILTQNTEKTTGMQKQIEITLKEDNEVDLLHKITNHNLWPIKFAPWCLTVMNLRGRAIVPQEPFQSWDERLTPVRPLVLWGYTDMADPRWIWGTKYIQLKQNPKLESKQKLGILNTLGWVAYSLGKQVFIKRYKYDPRAEYTDFGVNTEIYTDPDIFEIETLGEFKSIDPEEFAEHREKWYLFKKEITEDENQIDKNLLNLVNKTEKV